MENAAAGSTDRWTSGDQVETEGAGDAEPSAHMEVERSRDVPIAVSGGEFVISWTSDQAKHVFTRTSVDTGRQPAHLAYVRAKTFHRSVAFLFRAKRVWEHFSSSYLATYAVNLKLKSVC